jgi:hypothetical protein
MIKLKENYTRAKCCRPQAGDEIVGYYSYDNTIKVHRHDCANLAKTEQDRLVTLIWPDIVATEEEKPGDDFHELGDIDFTVLLHHEKMGLDYSLKVAAEIHVDKEAVFDCHARLRSMGLVTRVEPRMIRYRKGIVKGKWIKHRNHTYYDLTNKGRLYLEYYKKRASS